MAEEESLRFEVAGSAEGQRLDRFLADAFASAGREASRAALQGWIRDGRVTLNGDRVKPRAAVSSGDRIEMSVPVPAAVELGPEEIPISVLYEDDDVLVLDKEPGRVVHPGSGNASGTLANGLLHHCEGRLSWLAGEDRPGIVHRLDRDTSGCLVVAKSDRAYRSLVEQFSGRETGKGYLAVTGGVPAERSGRIVNRIGRHPVHRQRMAVVEEPAGKEAITEYEVMKSAPDDEWSLISCTIRTGRTHQIRVHMRETLGCAILGDPIYRPRKARGPEVSRLMLHAARLEFRHPASDERMRFVAPLPPAFVPFVGEEGKEA